MNKFAQHLRGQGATEYLVLLAVVLIVALVSIALLGFFPGLASDAQITQSAAYWKSARPFAILEHSATVSPANVTLVIQNIDSTGPITISNINVSTASGTSDVLAGSYILASGDTKSYSIPLTGIIPGDVGSVYSLNVKIAYTTQYGTANTQFGSKPIIGKYS